MEKEKESDITCLLILSALIGIVYMFLQMVGAI
jgi:hypothetical protein